MTVGESTYNWYWLVDSLQHNGHKVLLVNPAQMEQYNGLKHTDDKSDAFFLAEMLRLKILPTGRRAAPGKPPQRGVPGSSLILF